MKESSPGWKKNGAEILCLDAEFFTRCMVARYRPLVQASTTSPMLTTKVPKGRITGNRAMKKNRFGFGAF